MNRVLDIYAGPEAIEVIRNEGLRQARFSTLLGASGGPKWFVLYGLDKFLLGHFFSERKDALDILGSSVGSFRAACYAQHKPVAAIERLAQRYIETTYGSKYVSPATVTHSVREITDAILEDDGISAILNNPVYRSHFIVTRTKGLAASENRLLQGLGLLKSARINKRNRSNLASQYQRVVFQRKDSNLVIDDPHGIETQYITLTPDNTSDALLASGSLPIIMQGIKDIAGAPAGIYRDGGIVDYHFDIDVKTAEKTAASSTNSAGSSDLILYPHFSAKLCAGWFDKKLHRRVAPEHYNRVVLLCPSEQFISTLPYGKIPDRSDFSNLQADERMKYWRQTIAASERLADELLRFQQEPDWKRVLPISTITS